MTKLMKTLTFGVATAAVIAASASAHAFCPRGSDYGTYYKSYSHDYYGYKKHKTYGYTKYEAEDAVEDVDNEIDEDIDNEIDEDADEDVEKVSEISAESQIFEIAGKDDCDEDGCDTVTLRDLQGSEFEVADIEFDEALTDGISEEELAAFLANGATSVQGRVESEEDEDGETSYTIVVEKIYS